MTLRIFRELMALLSIVAFMATVIAWACRIGGHGLMGALDDTRPYVAEDIQKAVRRIRADLAAGCCTPERLEANLKAIQLAVADLADPDAPVFEVTPAGIIELYNGLRPGRPRAHLTVVDGGKP